MLPLVVDLAIVLLLLAVLGLGALLHRRLAAMRTDAAGLETLIEGLTAATGRAEHALGELRRTASETGERMIQDLARAQRLADDLRLLSDRADRLADGLVEGIRAARDVQRGAVGTRLAAAPPNGVRGPGGSTRPVPAEDLERALSTKMTRFAWSARSPQRQPRHGRSRTVLSAIIVLAGVLAVAKAGLLIRASGFAGDPPVAPGTEPASASGEVMPEPAAGPDGSELREAGAEPGPATGRPRGDSSERIDLDPAWLDASEREILEAIAGRRAALDERELELRAAVLETAEARLAEQVEQLAQLQAAIATMVEEHDAAEAQKLAGLVKIYETMKPKAAAEIFDRLEMDVLLRVVSRMSAARSAAVIARMTPKRAEQLTAELAKMAELPHPVP